jgi:hypothetical protein
MRLISPVRAVMSTSRKASISMFSLTEVSLARVVALSSAVSAFEWRRRGL